MEEEQLKYLVSQGLSISKIAKEVNMSFGSVRHWLKKYNLKTKLSNKEAKSKTEKHCPKCNRIKSLDEFYTVSGPKLFYAYCKDCSRNLVVKHNNIFKALCIDYKGGKCILCGYCKCDSALEFHHIDPTKKDFSISNSNKRELTEGIKQELDKCVLLCANCHREVHANLIVLPLN